MKRTGVAVHIESYAITSPDEVRAVLERYGFRAIVTANINFGPPPPGAPADYFVITVLVVVLTRFFEGFVGAAGKDAWELLKRLVADLAAARRRVDARGTGRVVLHDHIRHIEVLIPPDLPDEGYEALFKQNPTSFKSRSVVEYDRRNKIWREAGTLKPAKPGRPLLIFHPTFAATVGALSLPPDDSADDVEATPPSDSPT